MDIERTGVTWVGRTAGVKDGRPVLADGRTLDVSNVIWCTGYDNRRDAARIVATIEQRHGVARGR